MDAVTNLTTPPQSRDTTSGLLLKIMPLMAVAWTDKNYLDFF